MPEPVHESSFGPNAGHPRQLEGALSGAREKPHPAQDQAPHTCRLDSVSVRKIHNSCATKLFNTRRELIVGKIPMLVGCGRWNDDTDALAAIADKRLAVWLYPNTAFVDRDLLPSTIFTKDTLDLGDLPSISAYHGNRVTVRRADGVEVLTSTPALLPMLYETTSSNQWGQALRICRMVNDDILWGCLAAIALARRELVVARDALATIHQVSLAFFSVVVMIRVTGTINCFVVGGQGRVHQLHHQQYHGRRQKTCRVSAAHTEARRSTSRPAPSQTSAGLPSNQSQHPPLPMGRRAGACSSTQNAY